MSVRDIDFLSDRPEYSGPLIYRYRSGELRAQVREMFCAAVSRDGRDVQGCRRDGLLSSLSGGLFDTVYWCDWTALTPSSTLTGKLDAILSRIIAMRGEPLALFVPVGSSVMAHPLWPEVERAAGLIVEEELVTGRTLLPALRFFQGTTDLAKGVDWLAQPDFVASFATFPKGGKRTLLELRHAFDERVAACTDPETQVFLPDVYRALHPQEDRMAAASPLRALRGLLTPPRGRDCIDLVQALDERHNHGGWTARAIVTELHRITGKVLAGTGHSGARDSADRHAATALWTALLLSWDGRLRTVAAVDAAAYRRRADGLVGAVDRLVRDFAARAERGADADPLAGAWADLDVALTRALSHLPEPLGAVRVRTIRALDQALHRSDAIAPWLVRLKHRTLRAVRELQAAEERREQSRIAAERRAQDEDELRQRAAFESMIAHANGGVLG